MTVVINNTSSGFVRALKELAKIDGATVTFDDYGYYSKKVANSILKADKKMQNELIKQISYVLYTSAEEDVKVTDIFAECPVDYDKNSEITKQFYATVQNKFHFAITGQSIGRR